MAIDRIKALTFDVFGTVVDNGDVALLTNMAKHAGLPWDCVLSAEQARHYKPDPEAYRTTADLLGVEPDEVMMVAAHPGDLNASAKVRFQTAYVDRPLERPGREKGLVAEGDFDFVAKDFHDLADQLGC